MKIKKINVYGLVWLLISITIFFRILSDIDSNTFKIYI